MGLALDQLEFDDRCEFADGDDDTIDAADGLVTEPFVVTDAIATLRFNERGLEAPFALLLTLTGVVVVDGGEEGGDVVSSFELIFGGLESSFLSWTMSLLLPRKC